MRRKYEILEKQNQTAREDSRSACESFHKAASDIAEKQTEMYVKMNVNIIGGINSSLWAAATLLLPEDKNQFIQIASKSLPQQDQDGFSKTNQLSDLVLRALIKASTSCKR